MVLTPLQLVRFVQRITSAKGTRTPQHAASANEANQQNPSDTRKAANPCAVLKRLPSGKHGVNIRAGKADDEDNPDDQQGVNEDGQKAEDGPENTKPLVTPERLPFSDFLN